MGILTLPSTPKCRRGAVVVLLLLIYVFGANALYGLLYRNGYYEALLRLRDSGPFHLPGSSNAVLTRYTGIICLDKVLTLATVMFANVTDGTAPELSLYAFHFGGQYLAILVVIAIEGLRNGNQTSPLRFFSVWGSLMQATSYGCTMPLYGMIHILTSPTTEDAGSALLKAASTSMPLELEMLPGGFLLGYVIPATLMSIPVFSNTAHQWFGGLWQGSPIFSMLIQKALAERERKCRSHRDIGGSQRISQRESHKSAAMDSQSPSPLSRTQERELLSKAYSFAFAWCVISQITPLVLMAAVYLFPSAFPSQLRGAWSIYNVFVPPPFWSTEKMESMARGMHDFFLYDQYVGSTAAVIWSSAVYVNTRDVPTSNKNWGNLALRIVGLSALSGPAGAVVWLMWDRDHLVFSSAGKSY
ncbi:hypothetical protein M426DRAFT_323505 [Hypoxylon sp. CI-4A]|nr:hypothetical protein M426DRAFT_323505 [Hypoxylon sp. CI-4A]